MTAKKMADIFFGKFVELISTKTTTEKIKKVDENKIQVQKKPINKIFIILPALIIIGIILYYLN